MTCFTDMFFVSFRSSCERRKGVRSKAMSLLTEVISGSYQDLKCLGTVALSNQMFPFISSARAWIGLTDSESMLRLDALLCDPLLALNEFKQGWC